MASLKALLILALIGLVRLLEPIVIIRFGNLFVSRFGHLAANTECYLCERDARINTPKRCIDIWSPIGKPANAYLLKMYGRIIRISGWAAFFNRIGPRLHWWKPHTFQDAQWGRDIHNLLEKSPPHLSFTKAEERRGQKGLRELGIPEGAKWICIISRDSFYLKAKEPEVDYSYHNFRDSDINHYRAAAVALMQRGYYVVRMGAFVSGPMRLQAPQFIDYAVSGKRDEFMDIYLGAKCSFCISNGTGFDAIPTVFRRPICFVNESPFEYLSTWMKDSLAIWKHHVKDGKRMTISEIIESGAGLFSRDEQFVAAGITLEENTDDEIKDAALEMAERLEGAFEASERDDLLQGSFWDGFPRSVSPHNGIQLHGAIRLRIGQKFLDSYAK